MKNFKHYTFSGTYRQVGQQHGEVLRDKVREHLELIYDSVYKNSGIQKQSALTHAQGFECYVRRYAPGLLAELGGLAEGAEITFEEALLLQVRQEVVNFARFSKEDSECTSFALGESYTAAGYTFAGQNADLSGDFENLTSVLTLELQGKPKILIATPAGQISYIGLNAEGISANGNMLRCAGWKKGFPRYLLTRLALEQRTLQEACDVLERIEERASARNVLIADSNGGIADYEFTPSKAARIKASECFVHTNHFLSPDMKRHERSSDAEYKDSTLRKTRMEQLIEAHKGKIDDRLLKVFLRDHENGENSICAHGTAEKPSYHTFVSIIICHAKLSAEIARGNPCGSEYTEYKI